MLLSSLEVFGVHQALIEAWSGQFGPELLPVQQAAVRAGVLQGTSLLVVAPASSGKTLVAEMALARAALAQGKSLYLTPTRALAEEKFFDLQQRFGHLGFRVAIATRDHPHHDPAVLRGDFDILVAVPEKVRALAARSSALLSGLSVVIADEIQLLADPERGPALEMLLAEALWVATDLQVVAMTAAAAEKSHIADWLGAQLVEETLRPVELRLGVLHGGEFLFREHNSGRWATETLPTAGEAWSEQAASLTAHLAAAGEPTIVFVRDKAGALAVARAVAACGGLPAADGLLHDLRGEPLTAGVLALRELAVAGVAVHHSDLRAVERRAVERAFLRGELRAVVATSTLAVGVNLPARNVIIDPAQWQPPRRPGEMPSLRALPVPDFMSMAGRAGRLGHGDAFGRAILIADTPLQRDVLIERYVAAAEPSVTPALGHLRDDDKAVVLGASLIAAEEGTQAAWAKTLTARLTASSALPHGVAAALESLRDAGFFDTAGRPTALLRPAAAGADAATLRWLARIRDGGAAAWNWLAAMTLACATPYVARLPLPLGRQELRRCDYAAELAEKATAQGLMSPALEELLSGEALCLRMRQRAAKAALALLQWQASASPEPIEEKFRLPAARVEALASAVSWLMQILSDMAEALGWPKSAVQRLRDAAAALRAPSSGLGAAEQPQGAREPSEPSAQSHADANSPSRARPPAPPARPRRSRDKTAAPQLLIDQSQPDRAALNGKSFRLTPSEFRLLWRLAESAGRCVRAERLGAYVFGANEFIAPYQLYAHISRLRRKLERASSGRLSGREVIESVPRRGWRLNIPAAAVTLMGEDLPAPA